MCMLIYASMPAVESTKHCTKIQWAKRFLLASKICFKIFNLKIFGYIIVKSRHALCKKLSPSFSKRGNYIWGVYTSISFHSCTPDLFL